MTTVLGLVLAALVLVFFEVILPGGILGVLAALCVILATWLAGAEYGMAAGVAVLVGSTLAVGLLVFVEFKLLAGTALGKGFILKTTITGHSNEAQAEASVIGQEAVALTRLNPSGKVAVDGQSFEAYSQDGYVEAGQPVRIVRQDNFKLIIQKI